MEIYLLIIFVQGIIFGTFCSFIAREKNRDSTNWFLLGFLFSFLSILALMAIPKVEENDYQVKTDEIFDPSQNLKKCPDCAEMIKLEAKICRFCQHSYTDGEVAKEIEQAEKLFIAERRDLNDKSVRVNCGFCEASLFLDDSEVIARKYTCPECNKVNELNSQI